MTPQNRSQRAGAPRVQVQECSGDLLTQDVEALVNPWNPNFVPRWLLLPGGVSGQLKKRTGPEPWRALSKVGVLDIGTAVITGGGRMPVDLIHVVGINAFWRADAAGVALACSNAVRLAWETGYRSIALPLIGSGHGSMDTVESLEVIQRVLKEFRSEHSDSMLVRIVKFSESR